MEGSPAFNDGNLCANDLLETLGTTNREHENNESSPLSAVGGSILPSTSNDQSPSANEISHQDGQMNEDNGDNGTPTSGFEDADGEGGTRVSVPAVEFESPLRVGRRGEEDQMSSPCVRKLLNVEALEGHAEGGYDSDGLAPPEEDDNIDFEEEVVMERDPEEPILLGEEGDEQMEESDVDTTTPRHIPIPADALASLTVARIKHELFIRGVQFRGQAKKSDLLDRLKEALDAEVKVRIFGSTSNNNSSKNNRKKHDDLVGFHPSTYWEVLNPGAVAKEPVNTFPNARAPTQGEGEPTPVKHNFDEIFDRPVFLGKKLEFLYQRNGRKKLNKDGAHEFRRLLTPKETVGTTRFFEEASSYKAF